MLNPLKAWTPLILPLVLYTALSLLLLLYPGAATWAEATALRALPYILLGTCCLLGLIFAQSRITFLGILLAVVTVLVTRSGFDDPSARGQLTILIASIYVPAFAAVFYHAHERGVFSIHGLVRLAILASFLLVLLIPHVANLSGSLFNADSLWLGPVTAWIKVPGIGLVALLVAIPMLLIRNPHESPALGPLLCWTGFFSLNALNFPAWHTARESCAGTAFFVYQSGAAATLVWAIMESSWRHAHLDELTELPNRRALKHHLARLGSQYALAVLDIDHFKKINDRHGHDTGDQVLRYLAAFLRQGRPGKAYRSGGEEFVIVIERWDLKEAAAALDQLRKDIRGRKFVLRGKGRPRKKPKQASKSSNPSITVSVSIGVAENNDRYSEPRDVLEAADKALYRAKKAGRNQVKTAR